MILRLSFSVFFEGFWDDNGRHLIIMVMRMSVDSLGGMDSKLTFVKERGGSTSGDSDDQDKKKK